ncbi:MAG: hypothetical protein HQK52_24040 [Oligoflexia bacterium]|nr:hypothetical protein [Oligoflexia bacterium]
MNLFKILTTAVCFALIMEVISVTANAEGTTKVLMSLSDPYRYIEQELNFFGQEQAQKVGQSFGKLNAQFSQ